MECDQPAVLKNAPALLAAGKNSNVLPEVQAALKAEEIYAGLAGSYWPDLLVLQAHVILASGKDSNAAELATEMRKTKIAALVDDSEALRALIAARKGDHDTANSLAAPLIKDSKRPTTLAAASVALGLGYLEKKKFEEALKAFLELPVFLPDQTAFSGIAQLGVAQAYYGMEDFDRAITALETFIAARPGTPEIPIAESLLPEWKHRRTVVQEAKEP